MQVLKIFSTKNIRPDTILTQWETDISTRPRPETTIWV